MFLGSFGCTEHVAPPAIVPEEDPSETWAALLEAASSEDGVDFAAIAAERPTLDWYLGWVAVHGPSADQMKEVWEDKRLSFLLNAHNALVVQGVLRAGQTALDEHFWSDTAFRVDRDWMIPRRLAEERLLARFEDPLLYLALYQANRGGPPLHWWREEHLSADLNQNAVDFLASDRGMRWQGEGWAVSALLMDHAEDFVAWGESDTLCAWMAKFTRGDRRDWLRAHREDCPLGVFPVDPALDLPQSRR